MRVLVTKLATGRNAIRPRHDERVCLSTTVNRLLKVSERSVSGHRPTSMVVVVRVPGAPQVVKLHVLLHSRLHPVQDDNLVMSPSEATFTTRTVVGRQHDQRVVQNANAFQRVDHSTNLLVRVCKLTRKRFHLSSKQAAFVLGQRVPSGNLVDALGQQGSLGQDTASQLILEDLLTRLVPAHVKLTTEPLNVLSRRVVGRVHRSRRE